MNKQDIKFINNILNDYMGLIDKMLIEGQITNKIHERKMYEINVAKFKLNM